MKIFYGLFLGCMLAALPAAAQTDPAQGKAWTPAQYCKSIAPACETLSFNCFGIAGNSGGQVASAWDTEAVVVCTATYCVNGKYENILMPLPNKEKSHPDRGRQEILPSGNIRFPHTIDRTPIPNPMPSGWCGEAK